MIYSSRLNVDHEKDGNTCGSWHRLIG